MGFTSECSSVTTRVIIDEIALALGHDRPALRNLVRGAQGCAVLRVLSVFGLSSR